MSFRYLVENGTHDKKNLKPEQREFVEGMQFVREELIDSFYDYWAFEPDIEREGLIDSFYDYWAFKLDIEDEKILNRIQKETVDEALNYLKEWILSTECEYIGCTEDINEAEREKAEMEREAAAERNK